MPKEKKDKKHSHKKDKKTRKEKKKKDKKHRRDDDDRSEPKGADRRLDGSPSGSESDSDGDEEMWVEKAAAVSLEVTTSTPSSTTVPSAPAPAPPALQREDWMTKPPDQFSFGRKRAQEEMEKGETEEEKEEKRRKAYGDEHELNPYLKNGGTGAPPVDAAPSPRKIAFGDSGSSWRMIKLKRVYEAAEEEKRSVEDVALERYGSLEDFEQAKAERAFLDARRGGRGASDRSSSSRKEGEYRPTIRSRASFQRPGESSSGSPSDRRGDRWDDGASEAGRSPGARSLMAAGSPMPSGGPSALGSPHTPARTDSPARPNLTRIPSTFATPRTPATAPDQSKVLTKDELNKLQSKVLKAKLMGLLDAAKLEEEYERERKRADSASTKPGEDVVMLSHVDSRGRLQDIGITPDKKLVHAGPQRRAKPKFEGDDDNQAISDMLLQERMSSGADYDAEMASRIASDTTFRNSTDYMDDSADRLGKKKVQSEEHKRQRAIMDQRRAQTAQAKCSYCFQDDKGPRAQAVSLGTRAYLALPDVVDMVPGHCLIVPTQHVLTTLECDDDVWDEIRNFQKCLIKMFAEENKGVLFMEQVINFKWQKHTVIECIPVPMESWEDAPAYFKEAILAADEEWTQHRKLIDTGKNGFRRSMVKNLPYFHVWFDPNRGMGHVIEDDKSWQEWFGREVIGSMLELPPDKWRRPRKIDSNSRGIRMKEFVSKWKPYDWTQMLEGGGY
ncbi:hypothetical protein HK104_007611 [Borealophlyctis nickersoniae]|nr:hypothetical protein HK104_007611 [Borealophlyctis nickersoniae]